MPVYERGHDQKKDGRNVYRQKPVPEPMRGVRFAFVQKGDPILEHLGGHERKLSSSQKNMGRFSQTLAVL